MGPSWVGSAVRTVCLSLCVREREKKEWQSIGVCPFVCVSECVCERERDERVAVCVCVSVCVCVCV